MPTMPASTQRAHFEPAWLGDRLAALDDVAKRPLGPDGIRAIDCNMQWAWNNPADHSRGGIAFAMHWGNARQNNYRHIDIGHGRTRPMTGVELRRPIYHWRAADVFRWRRSTSTRSERPPTYAAMVRKAVSVGVVITAELKSSAFRLDAPCQQIVAAANRAGHPPWFMALYSMPKVSEKCAAIIHAGGGAAFAVIFGRFQWQRRIFRLTVKRWPVPPTRVW